MTMAVGSKELSPGDYGNPKPPKRIAGVSIMSVIGSFAKKVGTVAAIYLLGYFQFSVAWLIGPVIFSVIREEWKSEKEIKRTIAKAAAITNEKEVILARIDDLPSWVFFPDVERAEWVNKILKQVWPNVNHYAKGLLKETIEPAVAESLASYKLNGFQFQKMLLGSIPPRVGGVKVYDKNVSRNEILMDVDVFYVSDCDISFTLAGVSGGIKDFQIHGMVRVVMKPLITEMPMVGGLQIFFLNNPNIDFNLVGVADVLDMPGLSDLLRRIIVEQVAHMMVLPNKLPIRLSNAIPATTLKTPEPEGVLRIHVVEAKDLMKKDIGVLGKGKSDPYAIITVGAQTFKTKIIDNTVNPKWDYWCEFEITDPGQRIQILLRDRDDLSKKDPKLGRIYIYALKFKVEDMKGQLLSVILRDHDNTGKDEKLGRATLEINRVAKRGHLDTWINLEEAKHGMVHLRMTWFRLSSKVEDLKEALAETQMLRVTSMSSALLMIFIDSIRNLPNARVQSKPDPYVTVTLCKATKTTKAQWRTDSPVYEQGFTFLVNNPEVDTMNIKVTDNKTGKEIGELIYNISQLLEKPELTVDSQPFQLKKSGPETKIILSMKLKILKFELPLKKEASFEEDEDGEASGSPSNEITSVNAFLKKQDSLLNRKQGSIRSNKAEEIILPSGLPSSNEPEDMIKSESEFAETAPSKRVPSRADSVKSNKSIISNASDKATPSEYGLGKILLTMNYNMSRQRFVVVVHRISNLPLNDPNNIPDPYVKLYLLPERSKDSKRKTEVIKDDCNPTYEQEFEYIISPAELNNRQLEVSVATRKKLFSSSSNCLGQVLINLNELDLFQSVTEWFDLLPEFHKDKDD